MFNDEVKLSKSIEGHVRIYEKESGKVLLDRHNAIHPENISYAIAQALAGKDDGHIVKMLFGNGGARATSTNKFIYSAPQIVSSNASLYNETYSKDITVDDITISHADGLSYTDIIINTTLEANEPSDQPASNTSSNITDDYTFSEIGLQTSDGRLITHICHYPIAKSSNITLVISYMLRIQIV